MKTQQQVIQQLGTQMQINEIFTYFAKTRTDCVPGQLMEKENNSGMEGNPMETSMLVSMIAWQENAT